MEKLLSFCHKVLYIYFTITMLGCQDYSSTPLKEFSAEEKEKLVEQLLNGAGFTFYYQGSVGEQLLIREAEKYNNQHASIYRERGIPQMTRGMAADFYSNFQKMVELDSVEWQGYRGYYYMYVYRDYERAIADLDMVDARTPNFVDYPQTISVDYMRGICYERLNCPEQALEYLDKHIANETKSVGENYIHTVAFIAKGQAHEQLNQFHEAKLIYEKAIALHPKNADLKYYYGKLLLKLRDKSGAADVLAECRDQFSKEEFNNRRYVEEFYQIYAQDIEEAEMSIDAI